MSTFGSSIDGVATNVTTETKTVQTGRTRVYGVHVSGPAVAGVLEFKDGGATGTSKVKLNKAGHVHDMTINFPTPILFKTDVYSAFTTEQITAITVFHSGGSNS
jgi:hypothetical protein